MRLAAQPRLAVLSVALSVGFGSAEAFARAFKSRFGCSPSVWRAQQSPSHHPNSNPGQVDSRIRRVPVKLSAEHEVSQTTHVETIMDVRLINRDPVTVAYSSPPRPVRRSCRTVLAGHLLSMGGYEQPPGTSALWDQLRRPQHHGGRAVPVRCMCGSANGFRSVRWRLQDNHSGRQVCCSSFQRYERTGCRGLDCVAAGVVTFQRTSAGCPAVLRVLPDKCQV